MRIMAQRLTDLPNTLVTRATKCWIEDNIVKHGSWKFVFPSHPVETKGE